MLYYKYNQGGDMELIIGTAVFVFFFTYSWYWVHERL